MLKRVTFLLLTITLLLSNFLFASDFKTESSKKVSADAKPISMSKAVDMNIVSSSQLFFTDYDYAGNNSIQQMLWPYDIDVDGVVDPVGVGMQRFSTTEDGVRRVVLFLGLGGEFTTLDASDRTLGTGWGSIQSITAGPWTGYAAIPMHEGGITNLSVINLADFSSLYFHQATDIGTNFPEFVYLDDGTIIITADDGVLRTTSADSPLATTEVGINLIYDEENAADVAAEFLLKRSPNGQYLANINAASLSSDPGGINGPFDGATREESDYVVMSYSSDAGATWTQEKIANDGFETVMNRDNVYPLFANFGQLQFTVDNGGVVHLAINGYALWDRASTEGDTTAYFPTLYWNSRDKEWLAVTNPDQELIDGNQLADNRPGNGIGNSYPTVSVSPDGKNLVMLWEAPEINSGVLNVYPGDGGANTGAAFYTDIWYSYSGDGGKTWSEAAYLSGEADQSDVFPYVFNYIDMDGNKGTVQYVYMIDAIPGTSLFDGGNDGSENSYWNWDELTVEFPVTDVEGDEELTTTFSLQQNYPNPFNPSTTIKYSVPQLTDVSVKVYDVLGKEVATIVNTQQAQGAYEVNFDASNLASGMYIYTIKAGSFTSSKKMLLMK